MDVPEIPSLFKGIIEVTSIQNVGPEPGQVGTLTARFVRYPDCQQLSVWLPSSGYKNYTNYRLLRLSDAVLVENQELASKLCGSVRLLWDTLVWPPAEYRLEIPFSPSCCHWMYFRKLEAGTKVGENEPIDMPMATADSPSVIHESQSDLALTEADGNSGLYRQYRDGMGNLLPNGDEELRNELKNIANDLAMQYRQPDVDSPQVRFYSQGSGGAIEYSSSNEQARFSYEFGGGACKLIIDIPALEDWEQVTGIALARRRYVLLTIATAVRTEQAPNWRFEINNRTIEFY
ncbi:MAG: hypothetical protein KDB03_03220 [Planctomycetales bacterium]|nr:hypothetical protein [Planctomycetales bacterium]